MIDYGNALAQMSIHSAINAGMPLVISLCQMNGAKFIEGALAKNAAAQAFVLDTFIVARMKHLHETVIPIRATIMGNDASCEIAKAAYAAVIAEEKAKSPALAAAAAPVKKRMSILGRLIHCSLG